MKIAVCIPARYASTRFPAKVLARETGKYLIQHTWEQACKAKLPERVVIAADDERIVEAASEFGAECVLTSPEHNSGTDRIAEALGAGDAEIIVNVQGDEPQIDPEHIDTVARLLVDAPDAEMATLAAPFDRREQIADPNVVKVVVSSLVSRRSSLDAGQASRPPATPAGDVSVVADTAQGGPLRAIYFSRSVIPYDRENGGVGEVSDYLRHIGIYAYRREFLRRLTSLPQTPLEKLEKLEQLRAIEHDCTILVARVEHPAEGIDTPEQYAAFVARRGSIQ